MKPNEHMKLPEDEFIAHIRESLIAHEEDYVPGSWENFIEETPKKRGGLLWLGSLSTAAAVVLIGIGVVLFVKKDGKDHPQELTSISVEQKKPLLPERSGTIIPEEKQAVPQKHSQNRPEGKVSDLSEGTGALFADVKPMAVIQRTKQTESTSERLQQSNVAVPGRSDVSTMEAVVPRAEVAAVQEQTAIQQASENRTAVKPSEKKLSFQEFLALESKSEALKGNKAAVKKESKWEMGLVVAPSFGNSKKLNMGYGVSMGYALSDRVSISSGISYNEMGASRTINNTPNSDAMAFSSPVLGLSGPVNDSKQLHSVEANLRGIDIPIEIKYHVSKKVYANVGISAFAVLDQSQKSNFLESKVKTEAYEGMDGAAATFKTFVVNNNVSEETPKDEVKKDPYIGFYNISLGYRQKISAGKAFAVEPFLKLPIKEFTKENLYLIGTGVRLKFDF